MCTLANHPLEPSVGGAPALPFAEPALGLPVLFPTSRRAPRLAEGGAIPRQLFVRAQGLGVSNTK